MKQNELIQKLNEQVRTLGTYEGSDSPLYELSLARNNGQVEMRIENTDDPMVASTTIGKWDKEPTPPEILQAFSNWTASNLAKFEKIRRELIDIIMQVNQ